MENKKVLLGLSGGINSMAVLCWLVESGVQPSELHLFYAHFGEHSDDTFKFVKAGIRYARKHFATVRVRVTRNSALRYFEEHNMIPHPMRSPCSIHLKVEPLARYAFEHGIQYDLVGYVKHELKKRMGRQSDLLYRDLFTPEKAYPIGEFSEWCFAIVRQHIGWYPAIYALKDGKGKRLFNHNNCLPCKNGDVKHLINVKAHFPKKHERAMETSRKIGAYWGRDKAGFYAEFGRELGQESTCENCQW
jgi:hypothetical protein